MLSIDIYKKIHLKHFWVLSFTIESTMIFKYHFSLLIIFEMSKQSQLQHLKNKLQNQATGAEVQIGKEEPFKRSVSTRNAPLPYYAQTHNASAAGIRFTILVSALSLPNWLRWSISLFNNTSNSSIGLKILEVNMLPKLMPTWRDWLNKICIMDMI